MNTDVLRAPIEQKCITRIVTNPIRNPKILKIVDEITQPRDFAIEDVLYILMLGVCDDLLDDDSDYSFDPHGYYCPIVQDHLIAINGYEEYNHREVRYMEEIASLLAKMHDMYISSLNWDHRDHAYFNYKHYQCEIKSLDGSSLSEDNKYDDFILVFSPRTRLKEKEASRDSILNLSVQERLHDTQGKTKSRHSI